MSGINFLSRNLFDNSDILSSVSPIGSVVSQGTGDVTPVEQVVSPNVDSIQEFVFTNNTQLTSIYLAGGTSNNVTSGNLTVTIIELSTGQPVGSILATSIIPYTSLSVDTSSYFEVIFPSLPILTGGTTYGLRLSQDFNGSGFIAAVQFPGLYTGGQLWDETFADSEIFVPNGLGIDYIFSVEGTELQSITSNAQFPINNLYNDSPAKKARFNETTVILVMDLQESTEVDAVALHGDTNDTLGITSATYRYSINTDFNSSPIVTVPLSAENRLGIDILDTPVVCRYIELTLTGGSFVELSNIFIGKRVYLQYQNITKTSFIFNYLDKSEVDVNDYGQVFVDKKNKIKSLSGSIDHLLPDEFDQIDEILLRHGISDPLWIIVDSNSQTILNGLERLSIYGYLQKSPKWKKESGLLWSTSVTLMQAG